MPARIAAAGVGRNGRPPTVIVPAVALAAPPTGVDAVVSLCRIGHAQTPPAVRPEDHVVVWLVDADAPLRDNPNLGFVLHDTMSVLTELRAEGRTVLLHCVQTQTRTPTVAALYAAVDGGSVDEALRQVMGVLPGANTSRVQRLISAAALNPPPCPAPGR